MARTKAEALAIGSTLFDFHIAEVRSQSALGAKFTAPSLVTQQIHAAIKQLVTCCPQTPFKYSVAGLLEKAVHASTNQEAFS